ncbi:hypothetical protein JM658_16075 [Joostella atrarenae]|uniref:NVEALA family protein n=1 Tax=Joostella atrarenae TaxID=679257 RepID=A0ABS9J7I2_9FLAO|nr:hypothetical protein [Joostella atrarenae]MCF8716348.1 hypothetical protein [Joostella atrarenae]
MKKLLGTVGVLTLSMGIYLATNTQVSASSNDLDLTSLVRLNTANAECPSPTPYGGGKCLTLSQICVGDPGNNECRFG